MQTLIGKKNKQSKILFVLFNDMLLIASRDSKKVKPMAAWRLSGVDVEGMHDKQFPNAFRVVAHHEASGYIVSVDNVKKLEEWLTNLVLTIEAYKSSDACQKAQQFMGDANFQRQVLKQKLMEETITAIRKVGCPLC